MYTSAPMPGARGTLPAAILSAVAALVLGLTLTLAGSVATAPGAAAASCTTSNFKDVPRAKTSVSVYQAVSWVNCKGISTGYADRTFRPTKTVTRADFAVMLYKQVTPKHTKGKQYFTDVPKGKSYTEAVNWLGQAGLSYGHSGRKFKPSQAITRGDASVILYKLSGSKYKGPVKSPFKDLSRGKAYYNQAAFMRSRGFSSGYSDRTYRPKKAITRGETAVALYKANSIIAHRGDVKTAKMTPLPVKVHRASTTTATWKAKTATWATTKAKSTKTFYQYGGSGPYGYDCSGFTTGAFAAGGQSLPRTSKDQYTAADQHVPVSQAKTGDLVYWSNNGKSTGVYHVAVVVDADTIAHARNPASGVTLTDIDYSTANMLSVAGRFN
ncbi:MULTISPECIES: S-layer homology domain-containing protein [Citricoccus]|uniref:S-layer homology domain-containing protein n=1 Tax=Citricoccus TaxID=169133 RepID=UPI000255F06A|nr:S-layer homology domain-containing protein [Citricoccus sp. CH26A]